MEFRGIRWKIFHGILSGIGTEFHENISTEFYGVPQKLNSMEFCLVLGHGIPWNSTKTEFMEWSSTKAQLHGILSGIGTSKSMIKYPRNSIENYT